ncbi:MAG: hypothetical protein E7473_02380 [Ruminococcaceae bacterium]|nr:hypothetical protein [Oscillospiraceae bacterium]
MVKTSPVATEADLGYNQNSIGEGSVVSGREVDNTGIRGRSEVYDSGESVSKGIGDSGTYEANSNETEFGVHERRSGEIIYASDSEGIEIGEKEFIKTKDTAIKNEEGKPIAVYHATPEMNFEVFEQSKDIGFHFGGINQAKTRLAKKESNNGRVVRAYLNIKNPIRARLDINSWKAHHTGMYLWSEGYLTDAEWAEIQSLEVDGYDSPAAVRLREMLAEKGYDGIVYPNGFEGDGDSYIAFSDDQIIKTEIRNAEGANTQLNNNEEAVDARNASAASSAYSDGDGAPGAARPTEDAVASGADLGYNQDSIDYTSPEYETLKTRKPIEPTDMQEDKKRRAAAAKQYGLLTDEARRLTDYVNGGMCYLLNKKMLAGVTNEGDIRVIDSIRNALLKMPEYSGRTYRNLQFDTKEKYDNFLSQYSEGNTITLGAFTSSSKLPNGYPKFGNGVVHVVIDGASGRDIADTFGLLRQQEVLYLPGTTIEIKKVTVANDGNTLIFAQEVESNENIRTEKEGNTGDKRPERSISQNMLGFRPSVTRDGRTPTSIRGEVQHRIGRDGISSERGKSADTGNVLGSSEEARGKNTNEFSEKGDPRNSLKKDTATQQNNNEEAVDANRASTASSAYSDGDGVPGAARPTEDAGEVKDSSKDTDDDWFDEYVEDINKREQVIQDNRISSAEKALMSKPKTETKSMGDKAKESVSFAKRKMVNSGDAIRKIEKKAKAEHLYSSYNRARSASNIVTDMLQNKQTNIRGQKVGEGLEGIIAPIKAKGYKYWKDFQLYLLHKHKRKTEAKNTFN